MRDFLDQLKSILKETHPLVSVAFLFFLVYIMESHPWMAVFIVFSCLTALFFRRYGVFILTILADIADYFGAAIPIFGDAIDLFAVFAQVMRYGKAGFLGLLELIPMADFIPILTINAGIAHYNEKRNQARLSK